MWGRCFLHGETPSFPDPLLRGRDLLSIVFLFLQVIISAQCRFGALARGNDYLFGENIGHISGSKDSRHGCGASIMIDHYLSFLIAFKQSIDK
jgi:hypothetical protein